MSFKPVEVTALMALCHRRCCICHKFCGAKIEMHHIVPLEQSGDNTIENAIPVCFDCHSEIHAYNSKPPRGRSFTSAELRLHKNQWLVQCSKEKPSQATDIGPLQALSAELEINRQIARKFQIKDLGGRYHTDQFRRAITKGIITILTGDLRDTIIGAYNEMDTTNQLLSGLWQHDKRSNNWAEMANDIQSRHRALVPVLDSANKKILEYLGVEDEVT